MSTQREAAETLALQCLAWLAGHDHLLDVFMGATGASQQDLRVGAQDVEFLGSLLDFLMQDDAWVMEFCEAHDLSGDAVMQARSALPGGQHMHWT